MTVIPLSPHEELDTLVSELGQHPLARVLGKSQKQIWSWVHTRPKLRAQNAEMIHDTYQVVCAIKSRKDTGGADLAHLLEIPWPALNAHSPVELIQLGKGAHVVQIVVGEEAEGEAVATVALTPAWKSDAREYLEASVAARLTGEGIPHEDYGFIYQLNDGDVEAFYNDAVSLLAVTTDEEAWEAFIDARWDEVNASSSSPPSSSSSPAVAGEDDLDADLELPGNRLSMSLGDLLDDDGGITSRRFRREAVPA